ncbi:SWIM zinc finger family protein [Alkalibacterium thalassium]|uniref:SWIM-type domain-containing protein n=1 Tax=Alkalibacterium thalassium TaxID=426701 RepID=A0A1G9ERP7_9LACT|nr:hypothetical protein [Alkalibacterium thalassium]SDK78862.1 hypothetical protein SAMN04488098_10665 [Alkalibacterium thalassium]
MINLRQFEKQINSTILKRGKQYYEQGLIEKIYQTDYDSYEADIFGTYVYNVKLKMNKHEVIHSSCTCPFDFGPICKHEVSVFYKLRELMEKGNLIEGSKEFQPNDAYTLEELLDSLSKEELVRFIMQRAANDSSLEHHLRFKYGERSPEDELAETKRVLEAINEKYFDYKGNLHQERSTEYALEMGQVLNKALNVKDPLISCDIACLVMNELLELLEYFEDDDWTLGEIVDDCIRIVKSIVSSELSFEDKKAVYNKIINEMDHNELPVWEDFQEGLFEVLDDLAEEETLYEYYVEELMGRIKQGNTWSTMYHNERYLIKVFHLIERRGDADEQMLFLLNNIKYDSFRKRVIDKYFDQKDYLQVIQLTKEGENQHKHYTGKVAIWKELRYKAYKYAEMLDEQLTLGKELFLSGDFDYYNELKELYKGNEQELYEELKVELKKNFQFTGYNQTYLRLIREEQDVDALAEVVTGDVRYVREYAKYLQGTHKELVVKAYKYLIEQEASMANNRSGYRAVASLIKEYGKVTDEKLANEVTGQIRKKYSRRPAFMDELSKAKL